MKSGSDPLNGSASPTVLSALVVGKTGEGRTKLPYTLIVVGGPRATGTDVTRSVY
jgi:hypothetical protein